jgi:hypothetical protein
MAGLVPAIQVFCFITKEDVDARDKPGHDELCWTTAKPYAGMTLSAH